jgi:hypothetical protein
VAAVLRGDHEAAWAAVRAIAKAADIPASRAELAADRANAHPKFALPNATREGNTEQDLALSIYGFALGYKAATGGFASPDAARAAFEALFSAGGSQAAAIDAAGDLP